MMSGTRLLIRRQLLSLFVLGICLANLSAGGAEPLGGQRIFYTGHSFHVFVPPRVDQLAAAAQIETHKTVGLQSIGGSRVIQHWELNGGDNKARAALQTGEIDVITMSAHLMIPDPGIEHFTNLGLEHNPKLRLLVQASWMPFDKLTYDGTMVRIGEIDRDAIDLVALQQSTDAWRKKLEDQVDALNEKHGRRAVFIVPVGDAVNELRRQIKAGNFPGIERQSELFVDPIGHVKTHAQWLTAYCQFAAIYRRSPEGLMVPPIGVTPEQVARMQKIAWETVANYSHGGVK